MTQATATNATDVEKSRGGRRVQAVCPLPSTGTLNSEGGHPDLGDLSIRPSGSSLVSHDLIDGSASYLLPLNLNRCDRATKIPPGTHDVRAGGTNGVEVRPVGMDGSPLVYRGYK